VTRVYGRDGVMGTLEPQRHVAGGGGATKSSSSGT